VLPFPCLWVDGAWRSIRSDRQIEANVIGGEGNEIERRDNGTDATGLHNIIDASKDGGPGVRLTK
jgi:hypothetical protein